MNGAWIMMTLVNTVHLLATVAWIGGMSTNMVVLLPAMRGNLDPPVMGKLMGAVMGRFRILTYICIALLIVTGGLMSRYNASYEGFGFANLWTTIGIVKHLVVVILVVLAIYAFEGLAKKVARVAAQGPSPELARMQKRQIGLAATGFVLGLLVLLLTGAMTAISSLN
jgi:uncharacterized membrane protein